MYKKGIYTILSNEPLTPAVYRMVLEGDTQWIKHSGEFINIELEASSQTSGLVQALKILKGVKGISFIELNKKDIVRHQLVTRIVEAYEHFDKEQKLEREKKKLENINK